MYHTHLIIHRRYPGRLPDSSLRLCPLSKSPLGVLPSCAERDRRFVQIVRPAGFFFLLTTMTQQTRSRDARPAQDASHPPSRAG